MRRYFWLRIDWSGWLTKPWPTYVVDVMDDAIRTIFIPTLRAELQQPSIFHRMLRYDA